MARDISQPLAIVTGAGRGIGRATAVELTRRAFRLVLVSRTPSELKKTAAICGGGLIVKADVCRPGDVQRVVSRAMQQFGRVDVLVNAAGVVTQAPLAELKIEQWRTILDANLSAAYYFWRLLTPIWKKQGGAVVVNVSSFAARDPMAGLAAYGSAKAALNLLGLMMAREGRAMGVRVHTVAPAATETAMFRSLLSRRQYPTRLTLSPDDVARVIGQCVSGDLRHTSGEVIYVHKSD